MYIIQTHGYNIAERNGEEKECIIFFHIMEGD